MDYARTGEAARPYRRRSETRRYFTVPAGTSTEI